MAFDYAPEAGFLLLRSGGMSQGDEKCRGPECSRDAFSKGLCNSHYAQERKGKPLTPLRHRQAEVPEKCTFGGCTRDHFARGYCAPHWKQLNRGKTLTPLRTIRVVCSFPGCGKPHSGHGLCDGHNIQRRAGKELTSLRERRAGRLCVECGAPAVARDLCQPHYNKWHWAESEEGRAARQKAFRKRRAIKRACTVFLVLSRDRRRMIHRYRGMCAYCKVRPWSHWDHVIPLSRGGTESIGNLLPACGSCNPSKKARYIMEWRLPGNDVE